MQCPLPTSGPRDEHERDDGLALGDIVELQARKRRGENLTDRESDALARAEALPIVEKARTALAPALASAISSPSTL
jgi:hypothetical protein